MSFTPRTCAPLLLIAALCAAPIPTAAAKSPHRHATKAKRAAALRLADGGSLYENRLPRSIQPASALTPAVTGGVSAPGEGVASTPPSGSTGPTGLTGPTGPTGSTAPAITVSGGSGAPAGSTGASGPALPATPPGTAARILESGLAVAPAGAPAEVRAAIAAGNQLIGKPYIYGGGHKNFVAAGYDCSGAVSYALHGAGLLASPLDSGSLATWGLPGAGVWMSVYANPQHTYLDIAGIRLDTSRVDDRHGQPGPRWRPLRLSSAGYVVRHPAGF